MDQGDNRRVCSPCAQTAIRFNSVHGDCLGYFNLLPEGLIQLRCTTNGVDLIGPIGPSGSRYRHFGLSDRLRRTNSRLCRPHSTLRMHGSSSLPTARTGTDHCNALVEFHGGTRNIWLHRASPCPGLGQQGMANGAPDRRRPGEPCRLAAYLGETHDLWTVPAHVAARATLTERVAQQLAPKVGEGLPARRLA